MKPILPESGLVFIVPGPDQDGRVMRQTSDLLANFNGYCTQKLIIGRVHGTRVHHIVPNKNPEFIRNLHYSGVENTKKIKREFQMQTMRTSDIILCRIRRTRKYHLPRFEGRSYGPLWLQLAIGGDIAL